MTTSLRFLASLLGSVLLASPALADVYTWVDEAGTVHFAEEPPAKGRRAKKLGAFPVQRSAEPRPAESAPPRAEGERTPAPGPERPPARPRPAPSVELYTTSWCPWCKKAREYFGSRGIRFTEYNIEKDAGALERKLGVDGDKRIPTAVIGGKVIKGYSPAGYAAALEQR